MISSSSQNLPPGVPGDLAVGGSALSAHTQTPRVYSRLIFRRNFKVILVGLGFVKGPVAVKPVASMSIVPSCQSSSGGQRAVVGR